ncbi:hypothetical protein HAX54_025537 [Datura stramonium]|uniref:MADS-box domain-containing protein n=1 Tax=Datura stramonium TaxID=4076 RepID=A0ABS8S7Q4_DATST|nr:hypothetical protein [Datura stramonium]
MGRNNLVMKKIEDSTSRQQTYSKHKDNIVKKANELAILCDTDVALLMFSPNDQVTSYSSKQSVEDIMLRVVNQSSELNRRYYEPQVENIRSVEEASACQQFLMSSMERIQLSKEKVLGGEGFLQRNENFEVASVNTEDTVAADCIEESPKSCFSGPVCRNQQGMNVVRKQIGSQWSISFRSPTAAAGIILY